MLIARYAKIAMSLALAAFCLLVAFDNVTDYGTNYLFVQRVLSMDTTFAGNALMYRSITNPVLWQIAYALIIAAEGATGILFLAGAIRLIQVRNASGAMRRLTGQDRIGTGAISRIPAASDRALLDLERLVLRRP